MTTSEHFLPGKGASLETTIARLQGLLSALHFNIEETDWLNPVENIWSVRLYDIDCPLIYTNGKGTTKLAARASALGKFFERLSCNDFWSPYYLGETNADTTFTYFPEEKWFPLSGDWEWPAGLLTPDLQEFYDPQGEIDPETLVEFNSGNLERGICTLPFIRQSDDLAVYFPVNILDNLYTNNGMAFGSTSSEARTQALSEILERYVKFRVIRDALCLPDVPAEVIARFPEIESGIQELREAGFGILVRDASLGGDFPVMNVTLLNPNDHGCFASFGAHPRFEVALERALTELLRGRALDALDGFPVPKHELEEVASTPNLKTHFIDSGGTVHWNFMSDTPDFEFCDWEYGGSTNEEFLCLRDIVHETGHQIYIADYKHLGGYVCRILVPGMSEIYPINELNFNNNSIGNDLRPSILQLQDLTDEECGELLDALNDLDLEDTRLICALIGLAPDSGTLWEDLRVGELKTLLALAIGNEQGIHAGLEWIRLFGQINPNRKRIYHCMETLLALEEEAPYEEALRGLYGQHTLDQATRMLTDEERFFDSTEICPGLELQGCVMHAKLLEEYAKVQIAKAKK